MHGYLSLIIKCLKKTILFNYFIKICYKRKLKYLMHYSIWWCELSPDDSPLLRVMGRRSSLAQVTVGGGTPSAAHCSRTSAPSFTATWEGELRPSANWGGTKHRHVKEDERTKPNLCCSKILNIPASLICIFSRFVIAVWSMSWNSCILRKIK